MRAASYRICCVTASLVVHLALMGGTARASQYNVSEVPLLVKERDARKLHAAGLHSTEDILLAAAAPDGRAALVKRTKLPAATILMLVRRADLLRLESISPDWVLLLESVGVKSVANLAGHDPAALLAAIARRKVKEGAALHPPEARVRGWVEQAKILPALWT